MDKNKALMKKLSLFKQSVSVELPINKMIFFGSRAKGKATKDSDIDLIIVSQKFNKLKFRKRPITLYKQWNLDYPVDFLCYSPDEFKEKSKQITIVREALKHGIEIK